MSILKIDLVSKLKDWFYTKSEVDSKLQSLSSDAVNVVLSLDKYNCKVGDTVTVTVTVTGSDGVGLSDYKVNLYCNGTSLSNGITNDSGVYSYTYTAGIDGLLLFNVDGATVSCNVNRVMKLITSTSQYQLYSDGLNHNLYITLSKTTYAQGWITITTIPSEYSNYLPSHGYIFPTITTGVFLNLNEKGEIKVYNNNTSSTMPIYETLHYI